MIFIRIEKHPDLGKRFKAAAAMAGMMYADYLTFLLDQEDSRQRRQRAQQRSPLHRPTAPVVDVGEDGD